MRSFFETATGRCVIGLSRRARGGYGPVVTTNRAGEPAARAVTINRVGEPAVGTVTFNRAGEPAAGTVTFNRAGEPAVGTVTINWVEALSGRARGSGRDFL